jgi:hypothetical protein
MRKLILAYVDDGFRPYLFSLVMELAHQYLIARSCQFLGK